MKRIKTLTALAATLCCLASTSQAVIVLSGTGILPSTVGGGPGTTLSVGYEVDLTGLIYTYSYELFNPGTDTTSPNQFSVSFSAFLGTSVLTTSGGALSFVNTGSSVVWVFAPVAPGGSISGLTFTSLLAPIMGAAGANDGGPPAPWSTLASGGVPVAAAVPEPTTIVAGALLLLPFGASTIRFIRKNRTA